MDTPNNIVVIVWLQSGRKRRRHSVLAIIRPAVRSKVDDGRPALRSRNSSATATTEAYVHPARPASLDGSHTALSMCRVVYGSRRLASASVLRRFSRCSARRHLPTVTGRSVRNDRRGWRMTDDKLFGDGWTDRCVSLSPITHANTTIIQLTQTRHGPHAMMHPRASLRIRQALPEYRSRAL